MYSRQRRSHYLIRSHWPVAVSLLPIEPIWTMIRSGRKAAGRNARGGLTAKTVVDGASSGFVLTVARAPRPAAKRQAVICITV